MNIIIWSFHHIYVDLDPHFYTPPFCASNSQVLRPTKATVQQVH